MPRSYRIKLADGVLEASLAVGLDLEGAAEFDAPLDLGVSIGLDLGEGIANITAVVPIIPNIELEVSGTRTPLPWTPEDTTPQPVDAETAEQRFSVLTGHRVESWEFQLLTLSDGPIGTLTGVTEASFDASVANTIRTGGSLTCRANVDWMKVRVQPWYTAIVNGIRVRFPVGVFIPATPGTSYADDGPTQTVELYDKLLLLDEDKVPNTYTVDAGELVTDAITECIADTGETRYVVEASDKTVSAPMVWEAGTSRLRIINDLLNSINYFSLWADAYGVFRADPYVEPTGRDIAWDFRDDESGIYAPEFSLDADMFSVPNRVVCVSRTDGEEPALIAEATNENPDSPFSYQQRGRWITTVETDVEAADEATLDQIAARRLRELTQVTATYDIDNALLPINLNDAVLFTYSPAEIHSKRAVVQKYSLSTEVGALQSITIREVTE